MKKDAHFNQGRVDPGKKTQWSLQRTKSIDLNFSEVLFSEANGFCIKLVTNNPANLNSPFQKILEITPTKQFGNVSVSVPRWKLYLEQSSSSPLSGYRVCGQQGESIISFSARPTTGPLSSQSSTVTKVCDSDTRTGVTDIHIPAEKKNLGWIQLKQWFLSSEKTMMMMDRNVDSILTMEEAGNYIKFSNHEGVTTTILEPKRGLRKRATGRIHWTDWKIKYQSIDSSALPTSFKIFLLVASLQKIQSWDYKNVSLVDLAPP